MKKTGLILTLIFGVIAMAVAQVDAPESANHPAPTNDTTGAALASVTNRTYPVLFLVGDSTVHNPNRTQRGWGDVIEKYFDTNRIRVQNRAMGGRSSRTFITQGWWEKTLAASRPGDFVLLQMGHNDAGPLNDTNRARGSIRGIDDATKTISNPITKKTETVHTYGWYLRQYINDARARGMTIVLCSPIPHCPRQEVKLGESEKNDYVRFSASVAESEKVPFVDLNQIVMSHYVGMSSMFIKTNYFTPADNTHTSPAGAELNAQSVVVGLKRLKGNPLADFLKTDQQPDHK
jgi:lysophospholipase L1-like esterase